MSTPTYYRGLSAKALMWWIGAICGAIMGIAGVAKAGLNYVDARERAAIQAAVQPVADALRQFAHDDTLRHLYSQRQRDRINQVVDSIERAHQRAPDGRVLQAGNPR